MIYLITATPGQQMVPPKMGAALMNAAKTWIQAKVADGSFSAECKGWDLDSVAMNKGMAYYAILKEIERLDEVG